MLDERSVSQLAEQEGVSIDTVMQVVAEVEKLERTERVGNPVGLVISWLRKRKAGITTWTPGSSPAKANANPQPFVGWNDEGTCLRSAVPITNPQTLFAKWIVPKIRTELLTPAEVVDLVRREPEAVAHAIGLPVLADWSRFDHLSDWARVHRHGSLAATVAMWGMHSPPWCSRDSHAWTALLDRWCSRTGRPRVPEDIATLDETLAQADAASSVRGGEPHALAVANLLPILASNWAQEGE